MAFHFLKKKSNPINGKNLVDYDLFKKELDEVKREFNKKLELEKENNALKVRTLLDSVLSLIELLEEKEVFSEDELDNVFKRLDKESYNILKKTYAEYNASKEELVEMGYIDSKEKNKENQEGNGESSQ